MSERILKINGPGPLREIAPYGQPQYPEPA